MIILVKFKSENVYKIRRYSLQAYTKIFEQTNIRYISKIENSMNTMFGSNYYICLSSQFTLYAYFLQSVRLQQISCNFYIDFQIGIKFYHYDHDSRVSLQC